ncbi:MAG TPA: DUF47 family protein [Actinotalea sp.]|nr:DUF47 family protein [Actinotalea sp.]
MRLRLTPSNTSFFDLLAAQAGHLVQGAEILARLVSAEPVDRKVIATELRDAEHAADEAVHEVMRRLNQTFVTPFDRHDISGLASALDDCMDHMEEAGDLIVLYQIGALPQRVHKQIDVLQRCARVTAEAMPRLRSMKDLADYWVEINRLENEADKSYRKLLAEMFRGGMPAMEVMALKDVVGSLEAAADSFESVANLVETIALKES